MFLSSNEKIIKNLPLYGRIYIFSGVFESFESNPRLVQIAPPGESVVLISINLVTEGKKSVFNLCIPFITLQNPIRNLTSRNWNIEIKDDEERFKANLEIQRKLRKTETTINCILGKTRISLRDLLNFKVGDSIRLHQQSDLPLVLEIEGRAKFYGEPGLLGERKAVRITGRAE